jgi:hypothetical protein
MGMEALARSMRVGRVWALQGGAGETRQSQNKRRCQYGSSKLAQRRVHNSDPASTLRCRACRAEGLNFYFAGFGSSARLK